MYTVNCTHCTLQCTIADCAEDPSTALEPCLGRTGPTCLPNWLSFHLSLTALYTTHYTSHFTLHTPYCTLYTTHSILHTLHYTLYTVHFTLHTLYCTLYTTCYTVHITLHTIYCTLYTTNSILHTSHWTLNNVYSKAVFTLHLSLHSSLLFNASSKDPSQRRFCQQIEVKRMARWSWDRKPSPDNSALFNIRL